MVKANWDTEELIENWTLLPQELELVSSKVGANQIGFAVLLKYFQVFARFPDSSTEIPDTIISYIAQQLKIPDSSYSDYDGQGRSISNHRASIRKLFGFKTATIADGEEMVDWLKAEIIPNEQRIEPITELVYQQFRELQIEPPTQGRVERLIRIAEVSIAEPNGVIEQVIFPVVSLKTLKDLVAEYKGTGLAYKRRVHNVMRASFAGHYRRMIPQLLEVLEFHSNNDLHRPVIKALELLKKYAHSKARYYNSSEEIPIDGVLKAGAKEILMETDSEGNERINRINYEICVLTALRERLSCKEIWVVGANRYRNPDDDLPRKKTWTK